MNQYIKRKEILNREVCKDIECQDCPFAEGAECGLLKYILHNIDADDYEEWLSQCVDYGWFIVKMMR